MSQSPVELAQALQDLPSFIALVPQLQNKIELLETEINKLQEQSAKGWVVIEVGAKSVGLTTAALRQSIKKNKLAEGVVWKQAEKYGRIFVHVERLKEAI